MGCPSTSTTGIAVSAANKYAAALAILQAFKYIVINVDGEFRPYTIHKAVVGSAIRAQSANIVTTEGLRKEDPAINHRMPLRICLKRLSNSPGVLSCSIVGATAGWNAPPRGETSHDNLLASRDTSSGFGSAKALLRPSHPKTP
jgi:hypothetical protein